MSPAPEDLAQGKGGLLPDVGIGMPWIGEDGSAGSVGGGLPDRGGHAETVPAVGSSQSAYSACRNRRQAR